MRPQPLRPQCVQLQNLTSALAREDARQAARAAAAFKSTTEAKALVKTWRQRLNLEPSGRSGLPVECWSACLSLLLQPDLWDLGFVRDIVNAGKLALPAQLCSVRHSRAEQQQAVQAWPARRWPWQRARPSSTWNSCWATPAPAYAGPSTRTPSGTMATCARR